MDHRPFSLSSCPFFIFIFPQTTPKQSCPPPTALHLIFGSSAPCEPLSWMRVVHVFFLWESDHKCATKRGKNVPRRFHSGSSGNLLNFGPNGFQIGFLFCCFSIRGPRRASFSRAVRAKLLSPFIPGSDLQEVQTQAGRTLFTSVASNSLILYGTKCRQRHIHLRTLCF